MLLEIRDGSVRQGGNTILRNISFEIRGNEKAAVVGRNGAGKTTLLEVLAGRRELEPNEKNPDAGLFRSRNFTVGMLRQQDALDPEKTVAQMMEESIPGLPRTDDAADAAAAANHNARASAADRNDAAALYSKERFDYEAAFNSFLTRFGFSKEDKTRRLGSFSGGEQVKLAMIRLLLMRPEVLILDEPTNHLDIASTEWLEGYIRAYPGAVIMVSHDRYFLDRTANVVWEISHGHITRYSGNYSAYRAQKNAVYARRLAAWERQQKKLAHEKELIARFKNEARKAAFARSRRKIIERIPLIEKPDADDAVIHTGDILPARPGGKWVLTCEDLVIGYRKDAPLRSLSFRIRRGQKIGVMGPNGTGKSAFLKTAAGLIPPLAGKIFPGDHVDSAYFDQKSADRLGQARGTVYEWFHEKYPALTEKEARSRLAGFLFRGADTAKPVSRLSGGEKARLVLADILESRPNFLILDEPTNYMDIPARETIESLLISYKGTVLFVSHDRYFVDRVADALLIFEPGTTEVKFYPFSYSHLAERRAKEKSGGAALARSAEDQQLIDSFRAVPNKESHWDHAPSTRQANLSWRFRLNDEAREKAEKIFCAENEKLDALALTPFSGMEDGAAAADAFSEIDSERNENWDYMEDGAAAAQTPSESEDASELSFFKSEDCSPEALRRYLNPDRDAAAQVQAQQERTEAALAHWTDTLLEWYDLWLETQPAEE